MRIKMIHVAYLFSAFFMLSLFQNCGAGSVAGTDTLSSVSAEDMLATPIGNIPRLIVPNFTMPAAGSSVGFVNVASADKTAAAVPVTTTPTTGSGYPAIGSTTLTRPVRATNGCGTSDSSNNRAVEYHLSSGECNNMYSNFVVTAESQGITEAYVCFFRADQVQTSTNPAPNKCLFTKPMIKAPSGKFVWYSAYFYAFDGIEFTDYKVEVYTDKAMTKYLGSVDVGLRFPILNNGHFFTADVLEKNFLYGWSSSMGHLVFFPACHPESNILLSGWKRYPFELRYNDQSEILQNCSYKIVPMPGTTVAPPKSCVFAGGLQSGYACDFAPATAAHLERKTSVSLAGGVGTIEGTCYDGQWTNVAIACAPAPKKSCFFNGRVEGSSCIYEGQNAAHGVTKVSQVLSGGIGSLSATCNDGAWVNITGGCTPKKSCTFPGGPLGSCAGTFNAVGALHGNLQTTYGSLDGNITGMATAQCNDGEWINLKVTCY